VELAGYRTHYKTPSASDTGASDTRASVPSTTIHTIFTSITSITSKKRPRYQNSTEARSISNTGVNYSATSEPAEEGTEVNKKMWWDNMGVRDVLCGRNGFIARSCGCVTFCMVGMASILQNTQLSNENIFNA
jgi:hypothetical protein